MFERVEKQILALLKESIESYLREFPLESNKQSASDVLGTLSLDLPKEKEFGDLSCSISLRLSGLLRKNPKSVAEDIAAKLKALIVERQCLRLIKDIEVKGAGFINIFLHDEVFFDLLVFINKEREEFVKLEIGQGERLLLEFVSANPTGPLSVAHARQAAVGDALANVLASAGYRVSKEYYLNDEGNQINILGRSIRLRYKELCGENIEWPDEHYQGQYIIDLAKKLYDDKASRKKIEGFDESVKEKFFAEFGVRKILDIIKKELEDFGVRFDAWYSQKALGESGRIEKALEHLRKQGSIYDADGAVWFKSTQFGDDKDRVVRKSDGSYTYLAPDIAYHEDKFKRGFKRLVNIWGPDHHGYIPRLRAAIQALGKEADNFDVIIVQLATLFRNGQAVPMSTRKGQYVTLREVINEVGRDAARFFFLMRKTDSHLDFDLELAKKQTSENPVYYIQYAHARIAGILAEGGVKKLDTKSLNLSLLKEAEERDLMKVIFGFNYCLLVCAKQLDPYSLTAYLYSLAAAFHKFYDKHKVLSSDKDLTGARLFLIQAVKLVLARGLEIIGVSAPERM